MVRRGNENSQFEIQKSLRYTLTNEIFDKTEENEMGAIESDNLQNYIEEYKESFFSLQERIGGQLDDQTISSEDKESMINEISFGDQFIHAYHNEYKKGRIQWKGFKKRVKDLISGSGLVTLFLYT